MGRVFGVTKKLKSGHDRPHKVIRDENGVLLVDEEQVATPLGCWADLRLACEVDACKSSTNKQVIATKRNHTEAFWFRTYLEQYIRHF